MTPVGAETIYPVILKVPAKHRALSGRERVLFLRQYARRAVVLSGGEKGRVFSEIENDADGRPIPVNGCFWSLSHKPEQVAGVAALQPVGIDIETVRPVRPGLMERITDAEERRLADPVTDLVFFRFWTAKEAVLKALGIGLRGLAHCKIFRIVDETSLILSCHQTYWQVEHAFCDNHLISVACQDSNPRLIWIIPESGQETVSFLFNE
ncbi:MAG: 4'-phosphopantetheinyl transferase superfamily protein [Desulfobacteraceae bacterium]|nr:MAG: 4'-phosphopantetheinyl transferase superfamily protein [Desulfobacteraceae bacterium]